MRAFDSLNPRSRFNKKQLKGFLNVNSGAASGVPSNLGILDQIAALHWIQENIQVLTLMKRKITRIMAMMT